jgi:hypothetical protein
MIAALVAGACAPSAYGQTLAPQTAARAAAEQKQSRYQIGVMERVLEGAVEHGVTMTRDRVQALLPAEMQFISENAIVRGFRLEGYGVFFDVVAPSFEGTLPWIVRTLDQNDLGLDSALKSLKAYVEAGGDVNLQQALRRIELQVNPTLLSRVSAVTDPAAAGAAGARNTAGPMAVGASSQNTGSQAAAAPVEDPILSDPNEAYREEVKQALMDAMLDHSSSLGIGADEWLTVAVRRNEGRPRLAPADSDAGTMIIRIRGGDLAAFLARQLSREEALKRIDVRVF